MPLARDGAAGGACGLRRGPGPPGEGVCVQASTLGSLEALLEFLRSPTVKIPVSGINIGPVHRRDVMRASVMLEKGRKKARAAPACMPVRGRPGSPDAAVACVAGAAGMRPLPAAFNAGVMSCLRGWRRRHAAAASRVSAVCGRQFAVILAFDVPVTKEASELAESTGVRVFTADIIYHLFDQFTAYLAQAGAPLPTPTPTPACAAPRPAQPTPGARRAGALTRGGRADQGGRAGGRQAGGRLPLHPEDHAHLRVQQEGPHRAGRRGRGGHRQGARPGARVPP